MFERPNVTGFNNSHPAATGLQFLYLCEGQKLTQDLLRPGQVGVEVGAVLGTRDLPALGRCLTSTSGGATGLKFLNRPVGARNSVTFFSIIQPTSIAGGGVFIADSSDSGGYRIELAASGNITLTINGVTGVTSSGLGMVANAPYFVAISRDGATARFVASKLDSGYTTTSSAAVTNAALASDGAFMIAGGRLGAINGGFPGAIAMGGISNQCLNMAQMLNIARDPWGIVTPPKRKMYFTSAPAADAFIARQGLNIPQAVNRASTY